MSRLAEIAKLWYDFIDDEITSDVAMAATDDEPVRIDYETIDEHDPDLATSLTQKPDQLIEALEVALAEYAESESWDAPPPEIVGLPDDRVYDAGTYSPTDVVGELVGVRGQVTQRSGARTRDVEVVFVCQICGNRVSIPQGRGDLQTPHECDGCERKGPWKEDVSESEMVNYQQARIQALPEHTGSTSNEDIDVELMGHLVGGIRPGDRVIVNSEIGVDRINNSTVRELYADVQSIELLDGGYEHVEHEKYLDDIEELAAKDDIYTKIVNSIAPSHHGESELKLALALAIFGGVEKQLPDGSTKRGNSHILIIGDPGTGKSDVLGHVETLVPRSEYATGKQTSAAGLTASAVQDDFGDGGWTLQAGTLVKAHDGVACVDELDKMDPNDRSGMIQAMSEQKITIDKAASGTLPARTTVIAAANPKYGSFTPGLDLTEQLEFDSVLLSRFDLVFVIRDEVDEEMDREIAEKMNETTRVGQDIAAGDEPESESGVTPEIDPELFRAYVSYAQSIIPKLTDDAADKVAEDYVELRQVNEGEEDAPIPVTAREVEGIHRLAEASARIRLDDKVRVEDIERAINVRDYCLEQLGYDPETGELDALRLETGEPKTAKEREKFVTGVIKRLQDEADDGNAPKDEVKEECMIVLEESQYEHVIEKLKNRGDIYQPSSKTFRRT